MKISRRQLRRIIRESFNIRAGENRQIREAMVPDLHGLLLDYIWPCYQDGIDAHECISHLGVRELRQLRGRQQEAVMINDNPEFIAFCIEVIDLIENL